MPVPRGFVAAGHKRLFEALHVIDLCRILYSRLYVLMRRLLYDITAAGTIEYLVDRRRTGKVVGGIYMTLTLDYRHTQVVSHAPL